MLSRIAEQQPPHLTRRALVSTALAGGGALAIGETASAAVARCAADACKGPLRTRARLVTDGAFSSGVASGHPTTSAATLWTRVEGIDRTGLLELEVARDPGFDRVVHRARVRAASVRDFTAHARVKGLDAGEQYWFRFATRAGSSPVGRFRTSMPDDSRQPVRIGFFSCQDYQAGYYTAHAGLAAEEDLDLVVCLGDYIYERTFYQGPADRRDTTGANGDAEVMTLPEYRAKYQLYRSDPHLQALHAAHPFMAIWDDHEVEDNWARDEPGEAAKDRRGVPFLERRRQAFLAFREYMPFGRVVCPEPNRIYRTVRLGRNAELFLLDQRQYRDDQPCGDELFVPCPEGRAPGRTMLGPTQKEWLKHRLSASRATWKVIASQVMMMALDFPAGNAVNPDQWDGYAAERQEILEHVVANGIRDVTVVTGDIHTFFAGDVTTTGRIGGTPAATEFVGGSITSLGIPETFGFKDPQTRDTAALLTERIETNNPHIKYNEQKHRGYGVLEARPDELRVRFRGPDTATSRTSAIRDLGAFRVRSGTPAVEVVHGRLV